MKDELILVGGGGHCVSVIDVVEQEGRFSIAGIIDDDKSKQGSEILGYKVIGTGEDLETLRKRYKYATVTIGQIRSPEYRKRYFKRLKELNFSLPVIVSPLAYLSKHSTVGEGTTLMHGAVVNSNVEIGSNSIINSKALLEHDVKVGSHCHISTGALINGGVIMGDECFFGSGAVSREYIEIPDRSFIKANSIVK
jgi:sugar O-acyltransferase (sialic acid O-acetyltransferase NeuD family)